MDYVGKSLKIRGEQKLGPDNSVITAFPLEFPAPRFTRPQLLNFSLRSTSTLLPLSISFRTLILAFFC